MTEDDMSRWHQWLSGHEFEQVPGEGERLGSLVCWSPWGCKESDMTQQLNNNKIKPRCLLKKKKKIHIKDYNFKNDSFLSFWFHEKKCQWEVFCICISEVYFSNVYTVTWKTEMGSRRAFQLLAWRMII